MQAVETTFRKNEDWITRYQKLYSFRNQLPPKYEPVRISFMSDNSTPYTTLLKRLRSNSCDSSEKPDAETPTSTAHRNTSLLVQQVEEFNSRQRSKQSNSLGVNDTYLLELVSSRNREIVNELHDDTPHMARDEEEGSQVMEACGRGLSSRTERSVSRFSRMSTRRDMDIPTILAFTATDTAPGHLDIPAFQKIENHQPQVPRWSIRRSTCPVCSQKWRDRSSIIKIKNSGLKRNSSSELPSVIAPARLRTSVTSSFKSAIVEPAIESNTSVLKSGMRNTSGSWQLTRARRLRMPKLQIPSPETVTPPSCRPTARKDLDLRISKFLTDDF